MITPISGRIQNIENNKSIVVGIATSGTCSTTAIIKVNESGTAGGKKIIPLADHLGYDVVGNHLSLEVADVDVGLGGAKGPHHPPIGRGAGDRGHGREADRAGGAA